MKFCDNCGTRLKIKQVKKGDSIVVIALCERCGFETIPEATGKVRENLIGSESIKVMEDTVNEITTMPIVNVTCSKCGNNQAAWWLLQTRSSDEPPTQFYRCLKCNHTWRQYS
ncbi:MAG: transcription factor S [Nitrososphaerales archaeon]